MVIYHMKAGAGMPLFHPSTFPRAEARRLRHFPEGGSVVGKTAWSKSERFCWGFVIFVALYFAAQVIRGLR